MNGRQVIAIFILTSCSVAMRAATQVLPVSSNDELSAVRTQLAQIDGSLHKAQAIRAIKRLQYSYAHYAESGLWFDLGDLFAANGVAHYAQGDFRGPESLRKFYLQELGRGQMGLADGRIYPHIMIQPVVTVAEDGKSANGRWHVIAMLGSSGASASWAGVVYENRYVLEDGVWKINELSYNSQYSARYSPPGLSVSKWDLAYHFMPQFAGVAVAKATPPSGTSASKDSRNFEELQRRFVQMSRDAQELRDESDILNLQHTFGYEFDRKKWESASNLFASDGTLELGQSGVYAGRERIRRAFDILYGDRLNDGEVQEHLQLATVVHVGPDGRTAKARGVELSISGTKGKGAQWEEGIFENEYIRQNGVWKIRSLHYYPRVITDYDLGWAKDAKPAARPSTVFPPDRPPTEVYEIYPKMYYPRFHYKNPVTGAPVQFPPGVNATIDGLEGNESAPNAIPPEAPKNVRELKARLTELDRQIQASFAYDAVENLVSAHGYYLDDSRTGLQSLYTSAPDQSSLSDSEAGNSSAIHQTVQPVIQIAPDGKTATIRARLLKVGGKAGELTSGTYVGRAIHRDGIWRLQNMTLNPEWSSPFLHWE
jgi:hypothetical protein